METLYSNTLNPKLFARVAELNTDNDIYLLLHAQVVKNLICANFVSLFGRKRYGIVLKWVPHVQHAYFSSLDQSYSQFVALSILKLPNIVCDVIAAGTTPSGSFSTTKSTERRRCRRCGLCVRSLLFDNPLTNQLINAQFWIYATWGIRRASSGQIY